MNARRFYYLFTLVPISLSALPHGSKVKEGSAEFQCGKEHLKIVSSDKAIIHYDGFDIAKGESVEFVLPSSKATVLNRVESYDPSQILGQLTGNGKVFLLNPNGVYFGPDSTIHMGSFIASTLDIRDADFRNDIFTFFVRPETLHAKIHNEGVMTASSEGSIVLLAPVVENAGTILADVGKVVIASAERVTLDFSGDGLISFVLEGDFAVPKAPQIRFDPKHAGCVIKEVINSDGLIEAGCLIEDGGVVRLASTSRIEAGEIAVAAAKIQIEGEVVAEKNLRVEATQVMALRDERVPLLVRSFGNFTLKSPLIDILAWSSPYTSIVSGGDMTFISDNPISADGQFYAEGDFTLMTTEGRPQDFVSLFDPIVTASGSVSFGAYTGPSLKVEAGGTITCTGDIVITGADAMACTPSGCGSDPDCMTLTTLAALILNAGTSPSSPSCNPVPQTFSGTSFIGSSGSGSTISLGGNISGIETATFNGNVVLGQSLSISSSGSSSGDITFNGMIDGAFDLTINAEATNSINLFGPVGSKTPLHSLVIGGNTGVTSEAINAGFIQIGTSQTFNMILGPMTTTLPQGITILSHGAPQVSSMTATGGGQISITSIGMNSDDYINLAGTIVADRDITMISEGLGPITLYENTSLTSNAGNITLTGYAIGDNMTNNESLTLSAPQGTITANVGAPSGVLGFVTSLTIPTAVQVVLPGVSAETIDITANAVTMTGNVTTTDGPIKIHAPLTIAGAGPSVTFTSNGSSIKFENAVTVSVPFIASAGSGDVSIKAPFTSSSSLTFTGETIYLGANIATDGASVTFNGDVVRNGYTDAEVDTRPGAPIVFNGTINAIDSCSCWNLDLKAGAGVITLNGKHGNHTQLHNFSAEALSIHFLADSYKAYRQTYTAVTFNFSAPDLVTLKSGEGGIIFNDGVVQLSGGENLLVETRGGNFKFPFLMASFDQSIDVLAGNGKVTLGHIGMANNLFVYAANIILSGAITCNELSLVSEGGISNMGAPVIMTTRANQIYSAFGGKVGTQHHPISVDAGMLVFAGAPQKTAAFIGTTADGTIHTIPINTPCPLVFNGVKLTVCPPGPAPFPKIPARDWYVPGIYSQYNSLAGDYYFLPEVVTPDYVDPRDVALYYTMKHYGTPATFTIIDRLTDRPNYRVK